MSDKVLIELSMKQLIATLFTLNYSTIPNRTSIILCFLMQVEDLLQVSVDTDTSSVFFEFKKEQKEGAATRR
jgi:hypothetical protein